MMVVAGSQPRAIEVSGRITRCGCTPEQKASPDWHTLSGSVCPNPRKIEELGRIACSYQNRFRQFIWCLSQWLRFRRAGTVRLTGD